MTNSIDAHVEFSFKGETYSLKSTIDLENLYSHRDSLPNIHALLAHAHGIDTYSYLFEVMQEEEIEFGNAQGMAADFMVDGKFDHAGFLTNWENRKILQQLIPIVTRELCITDLSENEALGKALILAYNLGKESGKPHE